jgi:hypothetical protein
MEFLFSFIKCLEQGKYSASLLYTICVHGLRPSALSNEIDLLIIEKGKYSSQSLFPHHILVSLVLIGSLHQFLAFNLPLTTYHIRVSTISVGNCELHALIV